jgi:hypothetical protein
MPRQNRGVELLGVGNADGAEQVNGCEKLGSNVWMRGIEQL